MRATDAEALEGTLDGAQPAAAEAPSSSALAAGRVIGGRYEIVRPLGAGAMGAVYEARHRTVDRRVAVKVLHANVEHDPTILQRFLAEARAAGRARHRNIVDVLDFGADGPLHWMVLEYLDGESFEALVEREAPLAPARVAALIDPLLRALSHAHGLGFIHRDLKPANLFLAREEGAEAAVPKVLDFGIAKNTSAAVRLTSTETVMGTPAYMAPEQVESAMSVSPAADQYAMGCVVYEMLSGRLPITGDSLHSMLVAKVTREAAPLADARPGLPAPLYECVMRALERDPAKRFPDVESFRAALVSACGAPASLVPDDAPPAPSTTSNDAVVAVPLQSPPSPAAAPARVRRRGLAIVVVVAVATLGAAVAAAVYARPDAVERSEAPVTRMQPVRSEPPPVASPAAREDDDTSDAATEAPRAAVTDDASLDETERRRHHTRHHDRSNGRDAQGRRLPVDPTNPL